MFCGQFRPLIGGAESRAEKLAKTLLGMGCTVDVLTPRLREEWLSRKIYVGWWFIAFLTGIFIFHDISPAFGGLGVPGTGAACIANDIRPKHEVLDEGRAGILAPVESVDAL